MLKEEGKTLHDVLADPNARWSDIREAMKKQHVCTHGGLSQIIKNTRPVSIKTEARTEAKVKFDKDRLERDLNERKKSRFNPFGLSQELMMGGKKETTKKEIETPERRRSSKCDFGVGLSAQELKECHFSRQHRVSKCDIEIGHRPSLTLRDLDMSSEFEYDFNDSCDAEEMEASGLASYFNDSSFSTKGSAGGSSRNLFRSKTLNHSVSSPLDNSSQRTLPTTGADSSSQLSFAHPQTESMNKSGKDRSPQATSTKKKVVKKQEATYTFQNQDHKSQGDIITKFMSSFQAKDDEHKSQVHSKSNSPPPPEPPRRRFQRRSMDMLKQTFGTDTNHQPSPPPPQEQNPRRFQRRSMDMLQQTFGTDTNHPPSPPPPQEQNPRRFQRRSMDMLQQTFGTDTNHPSATQPPKQNGGIFKGMRARRTRSMDMVNHYDCVVDTDTVRRAVMNDMTGLGRTRRQESMEDMPNCDAVDSEPMADNIAMCSSVA